MPGDPLDRDAMLERSDHLWAELAAACDASPDATLHAEGDIEWTGKDLYGHFVVMHSVTLAALREAIETGEMRWPDARPGESEDDYNARKRAEMATRTFDDLRAEAHRSRDELRAFLFTLDAGEWARWGHRKYIDDIAGGHYEGHLGYIREHAP